MPFIALIAVIGILLLQPTGAIPLSSGRWAMTTALARGLFGSPPGPPS
jgi:hypothetical protein